MFIGAYQISKYINVENEEAKGNTMLSFVRATDTLIKQKKLDEAEKALNEGLEGIRKFPNKDLYITALERLAYLDALKGRFAAAEAKYSEAFNTAVNIQSSNLIHFVNEYAAYLLNRKMNGSLRPFLQKLNSINGLKEYVTMSSLDEQIRYNKIIGNIYDVMGMHPESVSYYKMALVLRDSMEQVSDLSEARNLKMKYEAELQEKENQILLQQNQLQRLFIFLIGIVMLLFSSFLLWKWYINKAKVKIKSLQVEALAKEKALLNQKLNTEKELVYLKEQIINEHRNELMIKNIENIRLSQQLSNLLNSLEQNESSLPDQKPTIPNTLKDDQWNDIILKFKQLNPDFVKKLQQYGDNLSKGDIEFCSMVRMNLSNKEIARILNISLESVRTKKYRLIKKLNLPDDDNFYQWVLTL
jgi:DNA-binding CsgD family transcriptional regulator